MKWTTFLALCLALLSASAWCQEAAEDAMQVAGKDTGAADGGSQSRRVISKGLMITWSEARDAAWGFCKSLGTWAKQEINPPAPAPPNLGPGGLIVSENVAVWQVGSANYAYSGIVGRWDVLRLAEGHKPQPLVDEDYVLLHDGDETYTFAATTGQWSSPTSAAADRDPLTLPTNGTTVAEPGGAVATTPVAPNDQFSVRVFSLKNARAVDARRVVEELFGRNVDSVTADERTNSVIVRALPQRQSVLDQISALLLRLDEPAERAEPSARAGDSGIGWPASQPKLPAAIEPLKRRYVAREEAAAALAKRVRDLQASETFDKAQLEKLLEQLHRAVGEAFQARQELHGAEISQLQQRIEAIQRNLEMRQKLSQQIIDRRVKDLTNLDTSWEINPKTIEPSSPTSASTESIGTREPTTIAGRPKVTRGTWADRQTEEVLRLLGLKAQRFSSRDAPEPQLVGAWRITAIEPDSPAKELQVDDWIMGIQSTGLAGDPRRRIELQLRRGKEHFNVMVEFVGGQATTADAKSNSTATSLATNRAAARAYSEKLQQRWEQLNLLYHRGRTSTDEALRAAKELGQAELAAAATADERKAALKAAVERLRELKAIVDAKHAADVEPEHAKLAVDAEVLKAEAALAAAASTPASP